LAVPAAVIGLVNRASGKGVLQCLQDGPIEGQEYDGPFSKLLANSCKILRYRGHGGVTWVRGAVCRGDGGNVSNRGLEDLGHDEAGLNRLHR
jgi:hypothetical protein